MTTTQQREAPASRCCVTIPVPSRLLFICSRNKWRSLTAEHLFDDHPHYEARAGRVLVTAGHLGWAEVIFVMEKRHPDRLREKFATELTSKRLINLRIPDRYPFQALTLVDLLRQRLAEHLAANTFL